MGPGSRARLKNINHHAVMMSALYVLLSSMAFEKFFFFYLLSEKKKITKSVYGSNKPYQPDESGNGRAISTRLVRELYQPD